MAFDLSAVSPIAFKLHLEILSDRPFSSYSLGPAIQHVPARSGDDTRASSVAVVFASLPFRGVFFFLISSLRPFPNQAPPLPQRKDDDNAIPVVLFSFSLSSSFYSSSPLSTVPVFPWFLSFSRARFYYASVLLSGTFSLSSFPHFSPFYTPLPLILLIFLPFFASTSPSFPLILFTLSSLS